LTAMKMKGQFLRVLPRYNQDDTINAGKMALNKCWFDAEKCKRGIEALENYQRLWDEKNEIWSSKPLHNWASHGSDAFRMFAMSYREEAETIKESDLQRSYDTNYDVFEY
jgi:phage terminase large subunit